MMMADRFQTCLACTLHYEGGWSNDPHDPGGATMKGIIQKEYDKFRDMHKLPRQSVRNISDDELQVIYKANYWLLVRGDELPRGVDLAFFDFAVLAGVGQAVKSMQRVLHLAVDGHLGMQTMAAIHEAAPAQLIKDYVAERRRFLRSLSTFWRFGKGWLARCDELEGTALSMAAGARPMLTFAGELPPDPDERSEGQGRAPAVSPAPPAATEATVGAGGLGGLAMAAPNIMEKSTIGGKFNIYAALVAILSEPLFWVGVMALVGTLMFYLHRRKTANA